MSQPTKEQWAEVATRLDSIYCSVYLLCDGFYVRYSLSRYKNRLVIGCYVDGQLKGAWFGKLTEESPQEAIRFLRPATRSKYPPSFVKRMEKAAGKRYCKKHGYYEKITYTAPYWNCPGPLIRHLIKHNDHIEIIDAETYKAGIAAFVSETNKETTNG